VGELRCSHGTVVLIEVGRQVPHVQYLY
jgi:hypothetical protein